MDNSTLVHEYSGVNRPSACCPIYSKASIIQLAKLWFETPRPDQNSITGVLADQVGPGGKVDLYRAVMVTPIKMYILYLLKVPATMHDSTNLISQDSALNTLSGVVGLPISIDRAHKTLIVALLLRSQWF